MPLPTASPTASPDEMCYDRLSMDDHLRDVHNFLAGARTVVGLREKYLTRFTREIDADYQVRLDCAKFTNVFRDVVENLASKPFARTVDLAEESKREWPDLATFVENVDGAGNHLHVFAGDLFFNSIAYTVDWLVVDKTPIEKGSSLKDERDSGARVYWYRVPHLDVLAVYSDVVDGEEIFTHFRFRETTLVRSGFGEQLVERVRLFDRQLLPGSTPSNPRYGDAYWQLYERVSATQQNAAVWKMVDSGQVGLGIIPLIPVTTGRRQGRSWRFVKTMDDVVHLQKKMYSSETNLEYAKLMAGSPMLSAKDANPPTIVRKVTVNGVEQLVDEPAPIVVGPKTVLYGEWSYINVDANALIFLAKDIDRTERQMREIGRQPLTTDSGNLTVVTTMFAAQKGNSAVQAWALGLKDVLERAFVMTAQWMNLGGAEPEVNVWTDFSIDLESEAAPEYLQDAQARKLISRQAYLAEGKRRNYVSAEYDAEKDVDQIRKEVDEYEFLVTPEEIAASAKEAAVGAPAKKIGKSGKSPTARVRADLNDGG